MGNITFAQPCGNQAMTRAYIKGLSLHDPCFNVTLSGQDWEFDTPGGEHWFVRLSDEFYPASSNHYTLDHVIDVAGSTHYTFGIPTPAFVNLGIVFIPGSSDFYIGLNCLGAQNPVLSTLLPVLAGYWRPFS